MKKQLLGIIASLGILANVHSQSLEPHGSVSLGYVPARATNYLVHDNQIKASLDFHLDFKLNRDMTIYIGSTETTYMDLDFSSPLRGIGQPTNQDYVFYGGFIYDDITAFIRHNCFHGFGDNSIDNSGETEVGLKYKW